jgi:hypothetical protein
MHPSMEIHRALVEVRRRLCSRGGQRGFAFLEFALFVLLVAIVAGIGVTYLGTNAGGAVAGAGYQPGF